MRTLVVLLGVLVLAPHASAGPEGVQDAPARAVEAAQGAAEESLGCLTQTNGTSPNEVRVHGATCTALVCFPVFVELETEPPGATPVLRPECVWDTISMVRGIIGI